MQTGSKELIRDINSNLVLETIIDSGPISRANISKKLGLTKATISAIVQNLIAKKLVIEIGSDDTSYGRKPILLTFHKKAGYAISIDFGEKICSAILTDLKGEVQQLKQIRTPKESYKIIEELILLINSMLIQISNTPYGLIGICIGIHGVTQNNTILFTPYYDITQIDFTKQLNDYYHVPIYLENEANLSVIAEHSFIFDYPNIANVSIHTGVGLGLILNHKLYKGYSGYAGEFGHTIIEINGRPCPCGNFGCLEQYISEQALLTEFASKKNIDMVSFHSFLKYYQQKDKDALETMHTFLVYMTAAINNILNTYNPEIIIINSSFTNQIPDLTKQLEHSLKSKMNHYIKIIPSQLENSSILLGGICTVIQKFLGINYLPLKYFDS